MKYFTEFGFSDRWPYEVLEELPNGQVRVRMMKTEKHPDWKPKWVPGGFAGHCVNQGEQKWLYESDPEGQVVLLSQRKGGAWYPVGQPTKSAGSYFYPSDEPHRFYDYNF